jgi:hypothetical protein
MSTSIDGGLTMYTTPTATLLIKGGVLSATADHIFSFGQQVVWLKKVAEA